MHKFEQHLRIERYEQTHRPLLSSQHRGTDLDPQRIELQEYCQRKGWTVSAEYSDQISGAKFTRAGLDRMMADVRKRKIDVILCTKLDRLGRSLPHMAQLIFELDSNGVAIVCTSQPIDTSEENPAGRLTMHILLAMADFERSLIKERTLAGLKAARARGSPSWRPATLARMRRRLPHCARKAYLFVRSARSFACPLLRSSRPSGLRKLRRRRYGLGRTNSGEPHARRNPIKLSELVRIISRLIAGSEAVLKLGHGHCLRPRSGKQCARGVCREAGLERCLRHQNYEGADTSRPVLASPDASVPRFARAWK